MVIRRNKALVVLMWITGWRRKWVLLNRSRSRRILILLILDMRRVEWLLKLFQ